jgi:hypothetical protein
LRIIKLIVTHKFRSQVLVMYFSILFFLLSISNIYLVWLFIELIFIFFLLFILNQRDKTVGLIIYFFFQSVVSLFLFMVIFFSFDKLIFLLLRAKLGLFPFFYWIVVVRLKVGLTANLFVLRLQKISVFWLLWLVIKVSLNFLIVFVYLGVFFVIFNLLFVRDLWLLLVYSSIANTGMIMVRIIGVYYMFIVFLYLIVIFLIVYLSIKLDSYIEMLLLIFFFLVIPPFILFFIKFYILLRLDYIMKLGFFLAIFDVFVLLYHFRLIFIKFILIDISVLVYLINLLVLILILLFRNCVTMIIFNKS